MTEQLVRPVGSRPRSVDAELRRRARAVIPGGMYGHQAAGPLPADYPQFMRAGRGARIWDENGTDATTTCVTIARAQTGRDRILVATGAYHGSAPWCTPRRGGVTAADRVNIGHYTFNDLASVIAAAEEGPETAAIVVSPFKHDAGFDQE